MKRLPPLLSALLTALAVYALGYGFFALYKYTGELSRPTQACQVVPLRVQLYTLTGQPVSLPDDQVQAAFLAQRVSFAKGAKIPVVSTDTVPGTVDAEDAAEAFRAGYTYEPNIVNEAARQVRCDKKQISAPRRNPAVAPSWKGVEVPAERGVK